jgi:hypothetical protein
LSHPKKTIASWSEYEQVIADYEKILKNDQNHLDKLKIERENEMNTLIIELEKFNADYPSDQLDISLGISVMFKQYLFIKDKIASQLKFTTFPVSTTEPEPPACVIDDASLTLDQIFENKLYQSVPIAF